MISLRIVRHGFFGSLDRKLNEYVDKFRDVLHQAIQDGLREGVDEVQQNGATQLQNGWMHIHGVYSKFCISCRPRF